MKIWLNTELVNVEEAELDAKFWPSDEGIFETLRTEDGKIYELSRHMRRAIDAANELGLTLPNEEIIRSAVSQLFKEEPHPIGRLRLMFSNKYFHAVHLSYEDSRENQKLYVSDRFITSEDFVMKRYPYTNRLGMLNNAKSNGFDEVICINEKNEITEGAVSNLLFLIKSEWVTPPLSSGVLPGIVRGVAIERCGVKVRPVKSSEIEMIESALVTSSLKIALPVASINKQILSVGSGVIELEAQIREKIEKHSVG